MRGMVAWYHHELRVALIERLAGFTVGTLEEGLISPGDVLSGDMRTPGHSRLNNETTGKSLLFDVEAEALTEEEATDLLGFIR